MLYVHGLKKTINGMQIINNVSFDLVSGQVLGFLGPNGAGKTTTMRMITGYLRPDEGMITICDTDILENPTVAQSHIGYLPEGSPLYGDMTTHEYLNFLGDIKKIDSRNFTYNIDKVIHDVMLEDVLDRPIDTLSKGYKRRVGLAGALLGDPPLLILDEPTDGLDPNQKNHVRKLISELAKTRAIIISTHILEEVDAICTDTVILNQGQIISHATPKELLAQSDLYNAVSIIMDTRYLDQATEIFKAHKLIRSVKVMRKMPKWTKIFLFPHNKQYILGEVSSLIHEKGWRVAGVQTEQGRLEEVFRRLTLQHMA